MDIEISIPQPLSKAEAIRGRARLYQNIRQFFAERAVLEVETSVLTNVVDAQAIPVTVQQQPCYLQHSPAIAMQPLVDELGAVYQIGKAFRDERDRKHASEFAVLTWCRPQFNLLQLMQEMSDLLTHIFGYLIEPKILSYRQAFMHRLDIDPLTADLLTLKDAACRVGLNENLGADPVVWLNWLFAHFVEPTLGLEYPVYLTDFPVGLEPQAAVKLDDDGQQVADCFELYMDALEIANVYQAQAGDSSPKVAVTLGLDRLLMVLLNTRRIDKV